MSGKYPKVMYTCSVNLHHFLCQGIVGGLGPEGFLSFDYCVLHPVEVLTGIAARGTGWSCWPGVGFNAGSYEKHLDNGEDGLFQ